MQYFLAKTDPKTYSIDDLQKDKKTIWDGVHSYAAINIIKTMKKGDIMIIYHSMSNAKIVGVAKILCNAYENKADKRYSFVVEVEFLKKFDEDKQISLKEIKSAKIFDNWALVKQGRLSTMTIPDSFIEWANLKALIK